MYIHNALCVVTDTRVFHCRVDFSHEKIYSINNIVKSFPSLVLHNGQKVRREEITIVPM